MVKKWDKYKPMVGGSWIGEIIKTLSLTWGAECRTRLADEVWMENLGAIGLKRIYISLMVGSEVVNNGACTNCMVREEWSRAKSCSRCADGVRSVKNFFGKISWVENLGEIWNNTRGPWFDGRREV